jgi:thiol:disulfide interchange protein DsbC
MMKTNRFKRTLCAALIGAALTAPCAAQIAMATPESVAQQLKVTYPATTFGAVSATAWPGVFEVAVGSNLAYVDASGQYFLFGHLYDMKAQRDLTAERKDTLARIDFAALPLNDALTEVRGSGARTLVIFSDPDCPYCKKLEADIANLNNVTIHTFLMPIASLHPQARAKAIGVWCAPNRINAWHALMRQDQSVASAPCDHPVDRNITLAERLGISGTPTLVAADGRVMAGAASAAQIEDWLARGSTSDHGRASTLDAAQ